MTNKYNKRNIGKHILAGILVLITVLSVCIFVQKEPVQVMAADEVYVNGIGYVSVLYSGGDYEIYLDKQKNLIIRGEYYTNSSATLSYHTGKLYFTHGNRAGNPTQGRYYTVDVMYRHTSSPSINPGYVYDTYTVSRDTLEDMIIYLFGGGKDALKTPQTVYMSEGFYLKERPNSSVSWSNSHIKTGKMYNSLNGILGAANWSSTTASNFYKYYDIPLTLNLSPYNLTVTSEEGGSASATAYEVFSGDTVTVKAQPEEGFSFDEWAIAEGTLTGFDKKSETNTFVMPEEDVWLIAKFELKEEAPVTKKPVATPDPNATITPEPTPEPEPEPEPEYSFPSENYEDRKGYTRYFTTGAGYTAERIRNGAAGSTAFAGMGSPTAYSFSKIGAGLDRSYSVLTDTNGNEWYAILGTEVKGTTPMGTRPVETPGGTYYVPYGTTTIYEAYYVHPKKYNGYEVDSADVRYITELTFPSSIKVVTGAETAKQYNIVSIGGGTSKYPGNGVGSSFTDESGYEGSWEYDYIHSYWRRGFFVSNPEYQDVFIDESMAIIYGVIGNGEFTSSGGRQNHYLNGIKQTWEYKNNYYIYNTTLEFITIPSTVTEILPYAFYNCQALRKISGGEGLKTISSNAFLGVEENIYKELKASVVERDEIFPDIILGYDYYYYDGAYTYDVPTQNMLAWQKRVELSDYFQLAEFPKLETLGTSSFAWHKNLFTVTMPESLLTISNNAFANCDLDMITILSETTDIAISASADTLGARAESKYNKKTIIDTVPESTAMYYGIKHEKRYNVRAGYDVTYHSNTTPVETYTSKSTLNYVRGLVDKKIVAERSSWSKEYGNGGTYTSTVILGIDGSLWLDSSKLWMPTRCLPDLTFTDICSISISNSNTSYSEDYTGVLAFATDGTVWLYLTYGYSYSTERILEGWTQLNVPEGSSCHQLVTTISQGSSSQSSSTGAGSSATSGTQSSNFLYYIGPDKNIYRMRVSSLSSYYSGNVGYGTGGSSGYFYASATPTKIPNPSGLVFESICVKKHTFGSFSTSVVDNSLRQATYSTDLPTIWAKATDGNCYQLSADARYLGTQKKEYKVLDNSGRWEYVYSAYWDEESYNGYTLSASHYVCTSMVPFLDVMHTSSIQQTASYPGAPYQVSSVVNFIDVNGNLISLTDTILEGINFTHFERIPGGNNYLIVVQDGGRWLHSTTQPAKLPDDVEIIYRYGTVSSGICNGAAPPTTYPVFLDSKDRCWLWKNGVLEQVSTSDPNYTTYEEQSQILGWNFIEPLFDNMFLAYGKEFRSWALFADGSGTNYQPGHKLVIYGDTDVFAQWGAQRRIVHYIANGGIGVMEDDVYDVNTTSAKLKPNTFTRNGADFVGWTTDIAGEGYVYKDEATVDLPLGVLNLYAKWEPYTYTVKIAEDDMRVTPVKYTNSYTLALDETMAIPAAKADKNTTVSYSLNKSSFMSTSPFWETTIPFSTDYTTASMAFIGWRLYEQTADGYTYRGFYEPGEVVKNLSRIKGSTLIFFPFWGGELSTIKLPTAECEGYEFLGFTSGTAYEANTFSTEEKLQTAIEDNVLISAQEGSRAQYQPTKDDEVLYAYYNPQIYEVSLFAEHHLAEPGEITQTQTSVIMIYDKTLPTVQIPRSERFIFMGYYDKLDNDGVPTSDAVQYYDENGVAALDASIGKAKTWTIDDGSVTTLYAYFTSETEVTLDGRGATKQEQTTVTVVYDEFGPYVIPPEKTGYTFEGYYTGIRGTGKKYYDASGESAAVWTEKKADVLYAYWTQNPVDIPEKEDTETPGVLPEDCIEVEVMLDSPIVQIYADDYNPHTDAYTDVPPFQVEDTVKDGALEQVGGIPSTECVAARAKMGSWLLSCVLERKSGVENVCVRVTIPYRTQYENTEDESLIISEVQYETIEVMVPKAWSYWTLAQGGVYFPEEVVIENDALVNGKIVVPVNWSRDDAIQKVSYRLISYGEKERHVRWSSYDESAMPILEILLPEEEYIISEVPGERPDVKEHLTNVCYNVAWSDTTQFSVKSDYVSVAGITLLSDSEGEQGQGAAPNRDMVSQLEERIAETTYGQTYQDGRSLLATVPNGRYETAAEITYTAAESNVGDVKQKFVSVTDVNEINIHTPVLCIPTIRAEHEDMYQCESIPEGHTVLVLDEKGIHSDFFLQIGNTGYHSDKKGYDEKNYSKYLAYKEGKEQNEVCFPFPVWQDVENDRNRENDVLLNADEWYILGCEVQRFYLPVETREGSYEIGFRSVAVNGKGNEDKGELRSNTQPAHYVAEDAKKVYVTGRLCEFAIYEVGGTAVWKDAKEELHYSVGVKNAADSLWLTLPLRTGVHPQYRNAGGLPIGGSLKFCVKSVGSSFGEGTVVRIIPRIFAYCEEEYKEIDVYYEKEEEKGVFLKTWNEEECTLLLTTNEEAATAVRQWRGEFVLPNTLYAAEKDADVMGYQERFGLSFTEEFWLSDVPMVLRFALEIESTQGERLFYGMIPEKIANNIWKTEAKDSYREDTKGNRFEIQGGEVAVIYPGDSADEEDSTHGIY